MNRLKILNRFNCSLNGKTFCILFIIMKYIVLRLFTHTKRPYRAVNWTPTSRIGDKQSFYLVLI